MLYAGGITGLTVLVPVEISGQWTQLGETVDTLAFDASAAASEMEAASSSWTGLVSSYEEPATQEVVRTAFNQVPEVTRAWSDVMAKAAGVLQGFATEAAGLEARASDLHAAAVQLRASLWISGLVSGLAGDLTAEDEQLQRKILRHNNDVLALNSQWEQLEQQTAERLDSLAGDGGLEEDVPEVTAEGGVYSLTAGGSSASGDGDGDGLLSAALVQMVGSGVEPDEDPVEEAQDRFDKVISDDATGQEVKEFYSHLEGMSAEEIEEFSEQTPAVHENSIPQPSSKEEYDNWPGGEAGAEWWRELEDAGVQDAVAAHLPLVVGNVQGVPYADRHRANKKALERLQENEDYNQWDKNLQQIDRTLKDGSADAERMLLSLDIGQRAVASNPSAPGNTEPHGWERQPLASISVGDPDKAATTSFGVPGMDSGTDKMQNEVQMSEVLYQDLNTVGEESHAVVSWVGYDAPPGLGDGPVADVLRDDRASQGGWKLAYALDGFYETRAGQGDDGTDFKVNVHAHSYGTNASAHALSEVEHQVDAFSMYGSSGIPEDVAANASELNVKTNSDGEPRVFASQATEDGTAWWGRPFGLGGRLDPTDEEFGAQVHYSGGEHDSDAVADEDVTGHPRHGSGSDEYGYLDPATQHFQNLSTILSGGGSEDLITEDDYYDGVSLSERFSGVGAAL